MSTATRKPVSDAYLDLIVEFPLRRLRTAAEHKRATKLILRLSAEKYDRAVAEYVDVLVDLVADFERRAGQTLDSAGVTAADLVRHRLAERGISISALAREISFPQSNLSEMLSGKRDWSKTAIRVLSKALDIRAERFLN